MPRGRNKVWFESSPGGIRGDLNPATIPKGEWKSSKNVLVRRGRVQPRPGYSSVGTVTSADTVTCIHPVGAITGGVAGSYIVHTLTKAYHIGVFTDITGTWSAATAATPARMANFKSGSTVYVLRVNSGNAVDKWDQNTANDFVDATGAPAGVDITTVGPYAIVCSATDAQVSWCAANDVDSWPASNVIALEEARAQGYLPSAVSALNNVSFAVYTNGTIHVCQLQAAKTAFSKQFVGFVPGPLHPSSLCVHQGVHYWVGWDYVLYAFDGASVRTVTSRIAPIIGTITGNTINVANGSYACIIHTPEPEYWISFPQPSGSTADLLSVNLTSGAVNWHKTAHYLFAMLPYLHDNNNSGRGITQNFLAGDNAGELYQVSDNYTSDDGTAIPWHFEYGYVPTSNNVDESGEIDAVASYWKKTSSSCTVTVSLTPSDSISDDETAYTDTFDTSTATSNHSKTFRGKQGKWAKLKFSGTQVVADLEYRGALLTSWQRSMT